MNEDDDIKKELHRIGDRLSNIDTTLNSLCLLIFIGLILILNCGGCIANAITMIRH